jgi:hypothetical protein
MVTLGQNGNSSQKWKLLARMVTLGENGSSLQKW